MKKVGVVIALFLVILFSAQIVSALTPEEVARNIGNGIATAFRFVLIDADFTNTENGDAIIFAKFLLLIVLTSILFPLVKKLPNMSFRTFIPFIVSLAISILGLQFVNKDIIIGLLLPSGAVAITLSLLVPLVLAGYFIESIELKSLRKGGWILLMVTFIGLLFVRLGDIGDLWWIYLVAIILTGSMLWLDGTVHSWINSGRADKYKTRVVSKELEILESDIAKLESALAQAQDDTQRNRIRGQLRNARRSLNELIKEQQ